MFEKQHYTMISPYWTVRPTPIRLIISTMTQYHLHNFKNVNDYQSQVKRKIIADEIVTLFYRPIMAKIKMPTNTGSDQDIECGLQLHAFQYTRLYRITDKTNFNFSSILQIRLITNSEQHLKLFTLNGY